MTVRLALLAVLGTAASCDASAQTLSLDGIIKCADAGIAECQYSLAEATEHGRGVTRDLHVAKKLYELAFKNGYERAGSGILRITKELPDTAPETFREEVTREREGRIAPAPSPILADTVAKNEDDSGPEKPGSQSNDGLRYEWAAASVDDAEFVSKWKINTAPEKINGAPELFGVWYGQTDRDFLNLIEEPRCTDPPRSIIRSCKGEINTALGRLMASAELYKGRVREFTFEVSDVSRCQESTAYLTSLLGRKSRALGRLRAGAIAGLMPDISAKDMPDVSSWNKKGQTVNLVCFTASSLTDGNELLLIGVTGPEKIPKW